MDTEKSLDDKNYDSDALMEILKSVEDPELKMSVVDSILDSKTDRSMKVENLDQILIVPKDKKFKDITQCSLCMVQASSSHTLKVHIEMTHLNLRFHCNICQRSSKEKYVNIGERGWRWRFYNRCLEVDEEEGSMVVGSLEM